MSQIDCITAILAIPAVEEDGEIRDAKPGEAILDAYVRRVEDDFARLIERRGNEASGLDNIWTEVLGIDRAGVDDTFFDLGGHSLLAVQIQTQLNQLLPIQVALADIFQFATVAQLSNCIAKKGLDEGIDVEEVCEILESIGEMTDEEVKDLLKNSDSGRKIQT